MSETFHVVPINDLIDHDTSTDTPNCICRPNTEFVEGKERYLIIHHSLDDREKHETR